MVDALSTAHGDYVHVITTGGRYYKKCFTNQPLVIRTAINQKYFQENKMSIASDLIQKAENLDLTQLTVNVNREERANVTKFVIEPIDSILAGAVVINLEYTLQDGSAHNAQIQTRFQRHDEHNKVTVDGVEASNIVVDFDAMLHPQVEIRFSLPSDEPAVDQEVTFTPGGGNGEYQFKL